MDKVVIDNWMLNMRQPIFRVILDVCRSERDLTGRQELLGPEAAGSAGPPEHFDGLDHGRFPSPALASAAGSMMPRPAALACSKI